MLIYLHGFNSGVQAAKAAEVQRFLAAQGLPPALVPALDHSPAKAMADVSALISSLSEPPVLIGSSLGGYYATWLSARFGLKAVLVNPAVAAAKLFAPRVGISVTNPYSGEVYVLDEHYVEELEALSVAVPPVERLLVLLQTGDETLDYRLAEEYYAGATLRIEAGGSHRFDHFDAHLPDILAFAHG